MTAKPHITLLKLLLAVALLIYSAAATTAQTPTVVWQKTYGDPVNREPVYASVRLGSNLYVHGGRNEVPFSPTGGPILLFTNANGDSLYNRIINTLHLGKITGMVANEDGTFMACGNYLNQTSGRAIFLLKLNQLGSIIWQKEYSHGFAGNSSKIIRLPDGYLVTGDAYVNVMKTDFAGNLVWQKTYGSQLNSGGQGITALPDGSYLATGWSTRGGSSGVSTFHRINYWLLKLRPNGDTIYTKVLGNPGNFEMGYAAAPTADGGVAVAGAYVANVPQTKRQGQVLKLDSLLNLEWELKVMPNGGDYEYGCEFLAIQPTVFGDYIVAGQNKITNFVQSYIARISPPAAAGGNASINWSHFIPWGVDLREMLYEDDGSAVVAGSGYMSNINGNNAQIIAAKFTNLGQPYRPDYCASPPQAHFTTQVRPDSVIFTGAHASASGLRYGVISKWEYLFGDGSNFVAYSASEARRVAHRYTTPAPLLHGTPVKLVVTNNLFCTDTLTLYPFGGAPTGLTEAAAAQVEVKTYPQPMRQEAMLELKNYQGTEKLQLQVTDLLGRIVQMPQQQLQPGKWQLQKGSLRTGLYLYRIVATGKMVAQGRLLVQ